MKSSALYGTSLNAPARRSQSGGSSDTRGSQSSSVVDDDDDEEDDDELSAHDTSPVESDEDDEDDASDPSTPVPSTPLFNGLFTIAQDLVETPSPSTNAGGEARDFQDSDTATAAANTSLSSATAASPSASLNTAVRSGLVAVTLPSTAHSPSIVTTERNPPIAVLNPVTAPIISAPEINEAGSPKKATTRRTGRSKKAQKAPASNEPASTVA